MPPRNIPLKFAANGQVFSDKNIKTFPDRVLF